MDIIVTWGNLAGTLPTDEFNVLYKVYTNPDTYNWIIANPSPLPFNATTYTITGLDANVIYRVAIVKSCLGTEGLIDEDLYINVTCPILSIWQGPPVNSKPTLHYTLYYPDSIHVDSAQIFAIDSTIADRFPLDCSGGPTAVVTGRTGYEVSDVCPTTGTPGKLSCSLQEVDFLFPSSLGSAGGYYGLDNIQFFSPPCNGTINDPILFEIGRTYKFNIVTVIDEVQVGLNLTYKTVDETCQNVATADTFVPSLIAPNYTRISGSFCYDSSTGSVKIYTQDGTNQTDQSAYTYSYITSSNPTPPILPITAATFSLPLYDNAGVLQDDPSTSYFLYCPVKLSDSNLVPDPGLTSSQLSDGMQINVTVYNPAATVIYTNANANYAGLTPAQAYAAIAADITANTSYSANYINIGGADYIKIYVTDVVAAAQIQITGENLFSPQGTDIYQVNPSTLFNRGVTDAFIYDAGAGDFIYGTRYQLFATGTKIQVSDIAGATTLEYNHPVDFPSENFTLVDKAPPITVYDCESTGDDTAYRAINFGLDESGGTYDGYTYYAGWAYGGTQLICYDASGSLYDDSSISLSGTITKPIRAIEVNNANGYIYVFCDEVSNPFSSELYIIEHTAFDTYAAVAGPIIYSSSNEFEGSTVTGPYLGTVASVNPFGLSITVAGAPWTANQWSGCNVQMITGAETGKQRVLYSYAPPLLPNPSNDTNTLFINGALAVGPGGADDIDLTAVNIGDDFIIFPPTSAGLHNTSAAYTNNQWQNYDLTITGFNPLYITADYEPTGSRTRIAANSPTFLNTTDYTGSRAQGLAFYFSKYQNFNCIGYDTPYLIYKINDGATFNHNGKVYYSCGQGQVHIIDSVGTLTTVTLLEPDGTTAAQGSFQFTADPTTNDIYAIMRDPTCSPAGNANTQIASKNIYRINTVNSVLAAIDGSLHWNENIAGNISYYNNAGDESLYFTSISTRKLFKYNINTNTFTSYTVPSVYNKSSSEEKILGAKRFINSKFVVMNTLKRNSTLGITHTYDFSNLFVFDINTLQIEQVLIGTSNAPTAALSPATVNQAVTGWNPKSHGEMFGEYCGYKDYCLGGLSIKVSGGKIYRKDYIEGRHYTSQAHSETGVAQIWLHSPRVTRIMNIQSDGSLVPSKRMIYTHTAETYPQPSAGTTFPERDRSFRKTLYSAEYSSFYDKVIGTTPVNAYYNCIEMIDPDNLTGSYGGPANVDLTQFPNKLSIHVPFSNQGQWASNFSTGGNRLWSFVSGGGQTYRLLVYDNSAFSTSNSNPFLNLVVGNGTDPGLYNVGYGTDWIFLNATVPTPLYRPIYVPSTQEIWAMGNELPNTIVGAGPNRNETAPRIIRCYNILTGAVTATIDLSAINAVPQGNTNLSGFVSKQNVYYFAGMDRVAFYGATNDKFILIDPATKTVTYNGLLSTLYNFRRTPQLTVAAVHEGWMVGYGNGMLFDYSAPLPPPFLSGNYEAWTYLLATPVPYNTYIHDYIDVQVNSNSILGFLSPYQVVDNLLPARTFGQWQTTNSPGWSALPSGGSPTVTINPNEVLELTMFDVDSNLIKVENTTNSTVYTLATHSNLATLPTFNTLNSINIFSIKADYVNLNPGDVLELTYENSLDANCPFVRTLTVNF